jgi:hypothetical protein
VNGPSRAAAPPGVRAPNRAGLPCAREDAAEPAGRARGELGRAASRSGSQPPHTTGAGPTLLTFSRLKWASFTHSAIYLSLLLSAFAAGKPEPLTEVLGWTHGLLWISMSLACLTAARRRIVPLRVAVAVAVLGGIGPFFGSLEFIREQRRRLAAQPQNAPR